MKLPELTRIGRCLFQGQPTICRWKFGSSCRITEQLNPSSLRRNINILGYALVQGIVIERSSLLEQLLMTGRKNKTSLRHVAEKQLGMKLTLSYQLSHRNRSTELVLLKVSQHCNASKEIGSRTDKPTDTVQEDLT